MRRGCGAVVLVLATLGGCGGSSPSPGGAARSDTSVAPSPREQPGDTLTVSCSTLVPADELRAILGVEPTHAIENTYPGATDCSWKYRAPGTVQEVHFQIVLNQTGGDPSVWLGMRDSESREDGQTPAAATGIGDEAYLWVGRGDVRKLYVRKGDRTLIVRGPVSLPTLAAEPAMSELASRLLTRF